MNDVMATDLAKLDRQWVAAVRIIKKVLVATIILLGMVGVFSAAAGNWSISIGMQLAQVLFAIGLYYVHRVEDKVLDDPLV